MTATGACTMVICCGAGVMTGVDADGFRNALMSYDPPLGGVVAGVAI